MSAFDDFFKDEIVSSIQAFIKEKKRQSPDIQINDLVRETLDIVAYSMEHAIWEIENPINNNGNGNK